MILFALFISQTSGALSADDQCEDNCEEGANCGASDCAACRCCAPHLAATLERETVFSSGPRTEHTWTVLPIPASVDPREILHVPKSLLA